MAATSPQAQLAELQQRYAEQKQIFDKWKIDNSQQMGTESYNKYVSDFMEWEREALKCISALSAQLQQASNPVSGPDNIDSVLYQLLEDIPQSAFVEAITKMNDKDKTFMPNLLNNWKRLMNGTLEPDTIMVGGVPIKTPTYRPPVVPYTMPTTMPSMAVTATRAAQWAPVPKSFRPPSPIRDYTTSAMPFKDFSQ